MNIAIFGKICTGKTTISNILVEDFDFVKVSLAKPAYLLAEIFKNSRNYGLNDFLVDLFPLNEDNAQKAYHIIHKTFLNNYEEVMSEGKPRAFLQQVCQNLKAIDNNLFINYLLRGISDSSVNYVCDDMRFQVEYDGFRANNWDIVKLTLPEEIRIDRMKQLYGEITPNMLNHVSETELETIKDFDFVLDTSRPTSQTREAVANMLVALMDMED